MKLCSQTHTLVSGRASPGRPTPGPPHVTASLISAGDNDFISRDGDLSTLVSEELS